MTDENTTKQSQSDENQPKEEKPTPEAAPEEATPEVKAEKPAPEVKPEEATPEVEPQPEADEPMAQAKEEMPDIKPGMTVRVHQRIRETNPKGEEKERIQIYEGMVLARKHGKEEGGTITVRKISGGIGVEKIFPLNSPNVVKIEPVKQARVRQSKLYFLRTWKKRLKETLIGKDK